MRRAEDKVQRTLWMKDSGPPYTLKQQYVEIFLGHFGTNQKSNFNCTVVLMLLLHGQCKFIAKVKMMSAKLGTIMSMIIVQLNLTL